MTIKTKLARTLAAALCLATLPALAQETGDPGPAYVQQSLAGKKVVLIPLALGFDLAQGWNHYIGSEVRGFGGVWETRDPNWDTAAGAQAITEASRREATFVAQWLSRPLATVGTPQRASTPEG